jgi:hypothetical protein
LGATVSLEKELEKGIGGEWKRQDLERKTLKKNAGRGLKQEILVKKRV